MLAGITRRGIIITGGARPDDSRVELRLRQLGLQKKIVLPSSMAVKFNSGKIVHFLILFGATGTTAARPTRRSSQQVS